MPNDRPDQPRSHYSAIFLAAGLYVFILAFPVLSPILLAFILILLVSLAINPVIMKLRRLSGGRTLPTVFVVLVFLTILGLTGWAFYKPIKRSTTTFIERLPQYWERIQKPILKLEQKAAISEERLKREVTTEVAREEGSKTNATATPHEPPISTKPEEEKAAPSRGFLQTSAGMILSGVTGGFKSIALNMASIVVVVVTVFFGVIFTLLRPRPVIFMVYGLVPEKYHDRAAIIFRRIATLVPRWALATLLGMTIIGSLIFFAMWPLFGFQDALVLGLIALVFEAVPYIGPILAAVPALLLAAGHGGWMPLWVLLAYICVQALENNVIMPVIVGGRLHLHPVAVIFSMLLCVTAFGVLGVLIALPTVAILIILHEEIYRPKFLPNASDEKLDKLARSTLERKIEKENDDEKGGVAKDANPRE